MYNIIGSYVKNYALNHPHIDSTRMKEKEMCVSKKILRAPTGGANNFSSVAAIVSAATERG